MYVSGSLKSTPLHLLTQPNCTAGGLLGWYSPVLHAATDADDLGGDRSVVGGVFLQQGTAQS
jgi:hypothetical protein